MKQLGAVLRESRHSLGAPGPPLTVSEEGTLNRVMSVSYAGIEHHLDGCAFCFFLAGEGMRVYVISAEREVHVPISYAPILYSGRN